MNKTVEQLLNRLHADKVLKTLIKADANSEVLNLIQTIKFDGENYSRFVNIPGGEPTMKNIHLTKKEVVNLLTEQNETKTKQ